MKEKPVMKGQKGKTHEGKEKGNQDVVEVISKPTKSFDIELVNKDKKKKTPNQSEYAEFKRRIDLLRKKGFKLSKANKKMFAAFKKDNTSFIKHISQHFHP